MATVAGLTLLAGCDAVQVVQDSGSQISVRYDGIMNGLDRATTLAQETCAARGKKAKLHKVFYEGLGAGERFAFFDCV